MVPLELEPLHQLEGYPQGLDGDIQALSRPPYYTACPNPFLADFIRDFGQPYNPTDDTYCREPYRADVSSQERHPVYTAHPYHTKVPPEIIRTLINHFCEPGGLVFDGFCGSGMTGVAALETGRPAVMVDLSTIATFVSAVNTTFYGVEALTTSLAGMLERVEARLGHLYLSQDEAGNSGELNYGVWSDIFSCPACRHQFPFFPHAVIQYPGKVETRRNFPCPACATTLNVRTVRRVMQGGQKQKQLVWVSRRVNGRNRSGPPSQFDLNLVAEIEQTAVPAWYPTDALDPEGYSAKLAQLGAKGINGVDKLLSRRNLIIFSSLVEEARQTVPPELRNACLYALTGLFTVISERQGYFGGGGGMSGNLYMPIVRMERNVFDCLRRKIARLRKAEKCKQHYRAKALVSTQSSHKLPQIPDNSIDYIYTDPPFGANIIYSEMNLLLESWLKVRTGQQAEIVVDVARGVAVAEFQSRLGAALAEFYRILKPKRWITLEFHNAKADVWNGVQQALESVGFVVAHINLLDKGSSTILQDIREGSVYQDLLISAYKPAAKPGKSNGIHTGTEQGVWEFVKAFLARLPVEAQEERRDYALYNRMVAYHLQQGLSVPLSAAAFYTQLPHHFTRHKDLYFLPDQFPA